MSWWHIRPFIGSRCNSSGIHVTCRICRFDLLVLVFLQLRFTLLRKHPDQTKLNHKIGGTKNLAGKLKQSLATICLGYRSQWRCYKVGLVFLQGNGLQNVMQRCIFYWWNFHQVYSIYTERFVKTQSHLINQCVIYEEQTELPIMAKTMRLWLHCTLNLCSIAVSCNGTSLIVMFMIYQQNVQYY